MISTSEPITNFSSKAMEVKMKRSSNTLVRQLFNAMLLVGLFSSCQKESLESPAAVENLSAASQANALARYQGLSFQTMWELQQARAASSRYGQVANAIADGYQDIAVDVENMGHHYMKAANLDAHFDYRQPEILVYNKDEKGVQQLVAVEYAVPLGNPRPEGFSGTWDVWDENKGFGLWLLHAWVWAYNPEGVFHATNPTVHLH